MSRTIFHCGSDTQQTTRICLAVLTAACFSTPTAMGGPLDQWQGRHPLPTHENLNAIAVGDGVIVVVGEVGTILVSNDETNWRKASVAAPLDSGEVPVPVGFADVAYGNGLFVAGTDRGAIFTSTDGESWRQEPWPSGVVSGVVNSITYGHDRFVVVGSFNHSSNFSVALSSANGTDWTLSRGGQAPHLNHPGKVIYGNGVFAAIGISGGLFRSTDGLGWEFSPEIAAGLPVSNGLSVSGHHFELRFIGGRFVVGYEPQKLLYSSADAQAWESHPDGLPAGGMTEAFGGFYRVGNHATVRFSRNLADWQTVHTGSGNHYLRDYAVTQTGRILAVGGSGAILSSTDGANWVSLHHGPSANFSGLAFGHGRFVAIGGEPMILNIELSFPIRVLNSTPSGAWELVSLPLKPWSAFFQNGTLRFVNGRFIGGDNGVTEISTDGRTWDSIQNDLPGPFAVEYGHGRYVRVGYRGHIRISPDGISWTPVDSGTDVFLRGVVFGNGMFVAVGDQTILTSEDGIRWVRRELTTEFNPQWFDVAYGRGRFVVLGNDGGYSRIATSANGVDWEFSPLRIHQAGLYGVAYGHGNFVAVGENRSSIGSTLVLSSTDGRNWTRHSAGTRRRLFQVAFGNSRFVASGEGGTILESGIIGPALAVERRSDHLALVLHGTPGLEYEIETSDDLVRWNSFRSLRTESDAPAELPLPSEASTFRFLRAVQR